MMDMNALRWIAAFTVALTLIGSGRRAWANDSPAVPPATPAAAAPPPSVAPVAEQDYDVEADTDPSALTEFRERLAPYGAWVDDARYGTIWVPSAVIVGKDFAPYQTAGRWAVAEDGQWLWVSDYEWGHIPFHYGRWVWTTAHGWVWIPGRVYAPAWVLWRTGTPGYDYIGWAPMPPGYLWMNGYAVGFGWGVYAPWWFCPSAYFFGPGWHTHIVRDRVVVERIVANTHVHGGSQHVHATAHAHGTAQAKHAPAGKVSVGGMPRSPDFVQARVPASAIPPARVPHDARAMNLRLPVRESGGRTPAVRVPSVTYAPRARASRGRFDHAHRAPPVAGESFGTPRRPGLERGGKGNGSGRSFGGGAARSPSGAFGGGGGRSPGGGGGRSFGGGGSRSPGGAFGGGRSFGGGGRR